MPDSGRPFPASPAAGEAGAGPHRGGDKLEGTYGPSSWSRQSRQELGGIYEAILSSPGKGKRENILRATASRPGGAAGMLRLAAIRPRRVQRIPTDPRAGRLRARMGSRPQGTGGFEPSLLRRMPALRQAAHLLRCRQHPGPGLQLLLRRRRGGSEPQPHRRFPKCFLAFPTKIPFHDSLGFLGSW